MKLSKLCGKNALAYEDYPTSMKSLTAEVRRKAIDIANALLGDGYGEGRAIAKTPACPTRPTV